MTNRLDKFWQLTVYSCCVSLCLGLGLAGLVGQPPNARQPSPQALFTPLVPDQQDLVTARNNRVSIEKGLENGGTVVLSNGVYFLDRAIMLDERHSGSTLRGAGRGTILRNHFTPSPYLDNCTLVAYPYPTSYAGEFELPIPTRAGDSVRIPETYPWGDPIPLGDYRVGEVVWTFTWNGHWGDSVMEYTRHVVRAVDNNTRRIYFDLTFVGEGENCIKWCRGHAISDTKEGDTRITLVDLAHIDNFRVGMDVFVTSGPEAGHEVTGEYVKIVGKDKLALLTDRPIGRAYTKAAVVKGPFLIDFNLEDIVIGNPVNTASNPLLLKFALRTNIRRVAFGDCHSAAFGTCGYTLVDDCDIPGFGGMGVNACHDFNIRRSRLAGLNCEESCMRISLADSQVSTVNGVHGIQAHLNCREIEIRNCRVEGFGYNRGSGNGSPFSLGGKDCRILDCVVRHTNPDTGSYLWGDGFRIRGLDCDTPILITGGDGWRIDSSRAKYWWPFDNTYVGGGRYTNVDGPKVGKAWEGSGIDKDK